jgi:hypothetical protein
MGSSDLPWMRIPQAKNLPNGFLMCQVLGTCNKFMSANASYLIKEYGECSSEVSQEHQVISNVELQILKPTVGMKIEKFVTQIFPSDCSQYLIPVELYNYKYELFKKHI